MLKEAELRTFFQHFVLDKSSRHTLNTFDVLCHNLLGKVVDCRNFRWVSGLSINQIT